MILADAIVLKTKKNIYRKQTYEKRKNIISVSLTLKSKHTV